MTSPLARLYWTMDDVAALTVSDAVVTSIHVSHKREKKFQFSSLYLKYFFPPHEFRQKKPFFDICEAF